MNHDKLDFLGHVLSIALNWRDKSFDPALVLEDPIADQKTPASEMFYAENGRYHLRGESVPGSLAVKSISIDETGLYLETSPLDAAKVGELLKEYMLPFRLEAGGFVDLTSGAHLIQLSEPVNPGEDGLGLRILWTFPLAGLSEVRRAACLELADRIFTVEAYEVEELPFEDVPITSRGAVQRMTLQLNMTLQLRLQAEQRPILALRQSMTGVGRAEQRQQLQQLLSLNFSLLHMSESELAEFAVKHMMEHGEAETLRVLIFALAGKVKRAVPGLTWKEARQVSRKLVGRKAS